MKVEMFPKRTNPPHAREESRDKCKTLLHFNSSAPRARGEQGPVVATDDHGGPSAPRARGESCLVSR